MHLTLRQIHYFVEIVDAGTMTRAAEKLHVAATALSLQIRAMEDRLGIRLLHRHSRGVRPTEAGAELYCRACRILAMVDETERVLVPPSIAPGRALRLGVPPSALRVIGVEAVLAGSRQIEGAAVSLTEGLTCELVERLAEGDLDYVLACELEPLPTMHSLDLIEETLVFATSRSTACERGTVTLAEALASDLVFYGEQEVCWKLVQAAARSAGLPVNVAHTVGSTDVIRHMVSCGVASAIVPFGLVEEERRRGEIAVHLLEDHPIHRRMSLAWLDHGQPEYSAEIFLGFVTEVVESLHAHTRPYSRLLAQQGSGHVLSSAD